MISTDQVPKIIQTIKKLIQKLVDIDEIQFGFLPGFAATNNILILRQLKKKHLAKKGEWVIFLYRFGESF